MLKLVSVAAALIVAGLVSSRQTDNVTAASKAYAQYRLHDTVPPYGLSKVKSLIATTKQKDLPGGDSYLVALTDKQYSSLSLDEKFTYVMIHPEEFEQNCDPYMAIAGEEHLVFGWLPGPENQMGWSDRQTAYLKGNKSKVEALLKETMEKTNHVGLNLKMAITELDAYALIPTIVQSFEKNRKDLDLLTVLFILMKDGHYKPFESSITYKKLYGPNSNYNATLVGNTANQNLTIQRAMAFYKAVEG